MCTGATATPSIPLLIHRGWKPCQWGGGPTLTNVVVAPSGVFVIDTKACGVVTELVSGNWKLAPSSRYNHTLGFRPGGRSHSILMLWDERWDFLGWYVNLEAPATRTPIGYDTCDYHLDVVIAPDRLSWRWKDEDHIAAAVDHGLFTPSRSTSCAPRPSR